MPHPIIPTRLIVLVAVVLAVLIAACGTDVESTPPAGEPQGAATATASAPTVAPASTPVPSPTTEPTALASPTAAAQTRPAPPAKPAADARSSLTELTDASWAFLQMLTNEFSPRESATDEERVAADFLVSELEALGLEAVLQPFTVEVLDRDVPVLSIDGPEELDLGGISLRLSAEGRVTGALVDVGLAFPEDVDPDRLRGKIALVQRGTLTFQAKVRRVQEAGAVGAVIYNDRPGRFAGRLTTESSIPAISISQENGEVIKARMADGEVTATVSTVLETADSRNVVLKVPSDSSGGRVVVLGAHYDTTPGTQGANDNGSGVAALMTIIREIADEDFPFDLWFVLFGAEELGLFGSQHFVGSLTMEERDSIVAMLNFDVVGTGEFAEVIGGDDLVDAAIAHGAALGVEVRRGVPLEGASSDHAPFRVVGIPVAFFLADDLQRINSPADTIEFVRPELLGIASAIGLGVLDTLAER